MKVNVSQSRQESFLFNKEASRQILLMSKLLQKYEKRKQSIYPVTAGGLQQYINRLKLLPSSANDEYSAENAYFSYLSEDIIQKIFVFLPPETLQIAQLVCKQWFRLINDDIFWRQKLERDIHVWQCLGHDHNPLLFCQNSQRRYPPLNNREIYLRCCPRPPRACTNQFRYVSSLTQYIRSFLPRKIPRLAMLGPGLESETSYITCRLMLDETIFSTVRMFPGHFGGMGTGFTHKMLTPRGVEYFDLTTIYSSSKETDNNCEYRDRSHLNKLFIPSSNGVLELTRQARDLCLSLDGLIYVVDANCPTKELFEACEELYALTQHFWAKPRVPILVLSLTKTEFSPRSHSCLDILRLLDLSHLNGVWRVYNAVVSNLDGIPEAFSWIIDRCNYT